MPAPGAAEPWGAGVGFATAVTPATPTAAGRAGAGWLGALIASVRGRRCVEREPIGGLQQQVGSASSELSAVQTQLSELQAQLNTERAAFQAEKKSLEDAITELGSVEERARAEQEDVKGEIRKHVQAAKEAQLKLDEVGRIYKVEL